MRLAACFCAGGMAASIEAADAAGKCRFAKRPPVVLKNIAGLCEFDVGNAELCGRLRAEQARCLLNPVRAGRPARPARWKALPAALQKRVGGNTDLPSQEALARAAARSRCRQGPDCHRSTTRSRTPMTTIRCRAGRLTFVFHDTSTPNYRTQPWPLSIDDDPKINNLARYECANDIERAHIFINRTGDDTFWRMISRSPGARPSSRPRRISARR